MLRQDHLYRGKYAVHVKKHHKLAGKHRTVLTAALPFMNGLLGMKEVDQVSFGKIFSGAGARKRSQSHLHLRLEGMRLHLSLSDIQRMQLFVVYPRGLDKVAAIASALKGLADQERFTLGAEKELCGHST